MTDPRLARIAELLTLKAEGQYGLSAINQRQHALQAGWLAEREGCSDAMIAASLLQQRGRSDARDLVGGFKAWLAAKLPMAT
jgi:predicted HD phosphohydrolase